MLAELDRVLRYPRFRKIHDLSDIDIEDLVRSIQQVAFEIAERFERFLWKCSQGYTGLERSNCCSQ